MTTTPQPGDESNGLTCQYDAWDRLAAVYSDSTLVATYSYDGLNRLITTSTDFVDGNPENVVHDYYAGDQLIETRVATGADAATTLGQDLTPNYQYVYGASGGTAPMLRDTYVSGSLVSGDRIYYLTDANDNVTALVGYSGSSWGVTERYAYNAYGAVTIYTPCWSSTLESSSVGNTLLFAGMQTDPTTGIAYDNARWYNSSLGTFLSTDPAMSSYNLYAYCGNDPIGETDPTGMYETASWQAPANPCLDSNEVDDPLGVLNSPWVSWTSPESKLAESLANVGTGELLFDPDPPPQKKSPPTVLFVENVPPPYTNRKWNESGSPDMLSDMDDTATNMNFIATAIRAFTVNPQPPTKIIHMSDGTSVTVLGGPPSSGAMIGQVLIISGAFDMLPEVYGAEPGAPLEIPASPVTSEGAFSSPGPGPVLCSPSEPAASEGTNALTNLGEGISAKNAETLGQFPPGSAFSGVANPESGQFLAYPSGGTRLLSGEDPTNLVPRNGGHAMVNSQFSQLTGTAPTTNVGYTIFVNQDGSISFGWRSGSVNGPNPSFPGDTVPEQMRPQIIGPIQQATGMPVR
jgi:RHS repeat-associated protein